MNRLVPLSLGLVLIFGVGCDKDEEDPESPSSFDRSTMLRHYADQLFVPAVQELETEVQTLDDAVDAFVQSPDVSTLQAAQQAWQEAYAAFQYTSALNFGPGESLFGTFTENVSTFPASATKIENYIQQADFTLDNFDRDSRGFAGMDYLMFDLNGDANAVINAYADANRGQYLQAIAADVSSRVTALKNDWQGYRDDFISNNGTGSGSSVSLMYNEWVKSFEVLKNFKVGLPAGRRPGQTQSEPDQVEAYYSGASIAMLGDHLQAIENLYFGTTPSGATGPGFDDYVRSVTGGEALYQETVEQWQKVRDAYETLPADQRLSDMITTNPAAVETLYTELSRHTRFFKSEMASRLGLTITFDSGDGD